MNEQFLYPPKGGGLAPPPHEVFPSKEPPPQEAPLLAMLECGKRW